MPQTVPGFVPPIDSNRCVARFEQIAVDLIPALAAELQSNVDRLISDVRRARSAVATADRLVARLTEGKS